MGLEDVLQLPGLLNLVTLIAALALWAMRRPSGTVSAILLVVIAGTGFHFVTDLVADLGLDGEHLLMHVLVLATVAVAAFK